MTTTIANVTVLGTGVLGSQIAYQITYSSNLADAVRDADLVIEAVPEDLDLTYPAAAPG